MNGQKFTINSRKYDQSLRRSWPARLIDRSDDHLLLEGFFESEVRHPDLGVIVEGTRSLETFFFERWYNYFVFYEPTGAFRNYYVNISLPPQVDDKVINYVDLDIDIIIWPGGRVEVLDEEEFLENAELFGYPEPVVSKVQELKQEILRSPSEFISLSLA